MNFQDPSVVQLPDGSYVAYAGVNGNPAGSNVLIATSPDFSSWTVRYGYDALPTLPLVQAVVSACGRTSAHHQMFTTAWRRLSMPQQDDIA